MKNYEEMAETVFRRIDEYKEAQRKRRKAIYTTAASLTCACLVAVMGFTAWRSGNLKPSGNIQGTEGTVSNPSNQVILQAPTEDIPEPTATGDKEGADATSPSKNEDPDTDNVPPETISGSVAPVDWQILTNKALLIVSGEVVEGKEPYHANPDGTLKNKYGEQVFNTLNYQYTVRVDEVFKGDVTPGDTVSVNIYNNGGEDPTSMIFGHQDYYLTVGEKCIFFLYFTDARTAEKDPTPESIGYETAFGQTGICRPNENGVYQGSGFTKRNPFTAEELRVIIEEYKKAQ